MGCDIHFYAERKVDGKWISADRWTPYPYGEKGDKPRQWVAFDDHFYRDRNYDLFAILANVRNGHGFAGCDTGDGFKPIAMPKGLPSDVSPEVKAEAEQWDGDGHSHSWLTLAELKSYDWTGQSTRHRGWVDSEQFQVYEKTGRPWSYSGGVSGLNVRHISNDQMREHIKSLQFTPDTSREEYNQDTLSYYTQVEWSEIYFDSVKPFVTETIPKLEALSYGNPENVRIVFWFDN